MAISWTFKISEIGLNSGNYSVSATVTDDTLPASNQTETVSVGSAKMDTPERKQQVWDTLKAQYTAKVAKTAISAALEAEGKTYSEA